MEFRWERTLPLVRIGDKEIKELIKDVTNYNNISKVSLINEGCRTTNYLLELNNSEKLILKIFFSNKENYKKEINLFKKIQKYINLVLVL